MSRDTENNTGNTNNKKTSHKKNRLVMARKNGWYYTRHT